MRALWLNGLRCELRALAKREAGSAGVDGIGEDLISLISSRKVFDSITSKSIMSSFDLG